jgi:benzylsuccinate CoA-transferase BbsE subunit
MPDAGIPEAATRGGGPTTARAALAGRRVLELADEKGLYCGKLFADMGADVVKVERPGGDATRGLPPFRAGTPDPNGSLPFLYLNTSKRGVTLDVTRPEGRALFLRLARTADVVIETFAPGYLASLGLGYEDLRALNPGLILTSITGYGQTGPRRHDASSDLVASALGGALYVTGEADDPPVTLAGSQAHVAASLCAAAGSMIALFRRGRDGAGQHVDISVQEAVVAVTHVCGVGKWLDDGIIPRRRGAGLFASVPSGTYPCKDGLVYLMVNRPLHWQALARWVHETTGNDAVLDPLFEGPSSNRLPYRDLLDTWIRELTARLTVAEAYHEGQRRHIAFTPVNSAPAVVADAQLAAREWFVAVAHAEAGTLRYPGAPYRHARTPWRIARPAPRVGEHNQEIYGAELGLGAAELAALAARGVV